MASGCILILLENKKEGRLWKQEQTYPDKFMTNYSPRQSTNQNYLLVWLSFFMEVIFL